MGDVDQPVVTSSATVTWGELVRRPKLGCNGTVPRTASLDTGARRHILGLCRLDVAPPVVGAEWLSTWSLTARRSEPRTQVGLVNHPAPNQLATTPVARRLSRYRSFIRDIATGLSSYNQQDDKTSAPSSRRKSVGASHSAGRVVMPLPRRTRVTTTLVECLAGASRGRGFESPRLHHDGALIRAIGSRDWAETAMPGPSGDTGPTPRRDNPQRKGKDEGAARNTDRLRDRSGEDGGGG